ncbi:MAG: hypothetical protein J3R72DRAFT_466247, partial [Linnemannia gamsii]
MSDETRHQSFQQGHGRILQVEAHYHHDAGQHVVFWQDILDTFPGAASVLNGTVAISRARDASHNFVEPRCIKYLSGKVIEVVLVEDITPHSPGSLALVTSEKAPPSRDLNHKSIEEWRSKTTAENVSLFGSNYAPTIYSEESSTTTPAFTRLNVPTESKAGSLWSERVQNAPQEEHRSIEVADVQETQDQQRIRNDSPCSQEVLPTSISITQALATMIARAESGDLVAQETLGDMYMDDQKYSQAMIWYRMAAEQGLANSQYNIGILYNQGLGVSQNHAEAMTWFRKAAEQGDALAQLDIGIIYTDGLGVLQDHVEAMTWLRKAAEQGVAVAQYKIGKLYYQGLGVSQDFSEAMTWYQKAAEQGDVKVHCHIGLMYEQGLGVSQNYVEAMTWFRMAACN